MTLLRCLTHHEIYVPQGLDSETSYKPGIITTSIVSEEMQFMSKLLKENKLFIYFLKIMVGGVYEVSW